VPIRTPKGFLIRMEETVMDLLSEIAKSDPQLADALLRLLNELELAKFERHKFR
jgi:hypothetical protein